MNEQASAGRKLLLEVLDAPHILSGIGPDADLVQAGVNSGDLIRVGLLIEERSRKPLSDEDLMDLQTISGIDRVLSTRAIA